MHFERWYAGDQCCECQSGARGRTCPANSQIFLGVPEEASFTAVVQEHQLSLIPENLQEKPSPCLHPAVWGSGLVLHIKCLCTKSFKVSSEKTPNPHHQLSVGDGEKQFREFPGQRWVAVARIMLTHWFKHALWSSGHFKNFLPEHQP